MYMKCICLYFAEFVILKCSRPLPQIQQGHYVSIGREQRGELDRFIVHMLCYWVLLSTCRGKCGGEPGGEGQESGGLSF